MSSLITLGGPVISTSLAFLLLSQSVSLLQVLGGVVVLVGLGGVIISAATARSAKSAEVGTVDPLLNSNP